METALHPDWGLLIFRFGETVAAEDLRRITLFLSSGKLDPRLYPKQLMDLGEVRAVDVTFDALSGYAAVRRRLPATVQPTQSAFLVRRPVTVGFFSMYRSLLEGPDLECEMCRTYARIARWLDVPEDTLTPPDPES